MKSSFCLLLLITAALSLTACVDPYYAGGYAPPPGPVVVTPPRPVYVTPAPVVVAPRPVYVAPRPVYVAPRPVYPPNHYYGPRRW